MDLANALSSTTTNTSHNETSSRSESEVDELSSNPPVQHHVSPPATPKATPSHDSPPALRRPETIGTIIELRPSDKGGLGIFALKDLPPQTVLLCELPLLTLTESTFSPPSPDPLDAIINVLSPSHRAAYLCLHHFPQDPDEPVHRSILRTNGYSIADDHSTTAVFETASRINHACVPNAEFTWKESIGKMLFWNRFKLLQGEEVTVDYGYGRPALRRNYGFECDCGGCTDGEGEPSGEHGSADGASSYTS